MAVITTGSVPKALAGKSREPKAKPEKKKAPPKTKSKKRKK